MRYPSPPPTGWPVMPMISISTRSTLAAVVVIAPFESRNVKLKPFIQRSDGSAKGDWDVGITIDILLTAPTLDRIFLLSGDGDFDLLLETVRTRYDTPVEVYGVPALTAGSLKRAASCFHPISEPLLLS